MLLLAAIVWSRVPQNERDREDENGVVRNRPRGSVDGECGLNHHCEGGTGIVERHPRRRTHCLRGIPFAAPPVGDLRWRPPQPPAKWQGVRPADKFAPQCVQSFGGGPEDSKPPAMSEDCLYLNVWTPARSARDRIPVLVWIYGGGFNAGATSVPTYSGEMLARKGVVLVSIAYRVGPLGFLAHPELSAESPHHVSGNYGLLDMIAALQWIKKNIAAFGGDPNKVTIFGESAGGIAVSQLCASPLAKGLFEGAISRKRRLVRPSAPRRRSRARTCVCLPMRSATARSLARDAGAASIAELRKMPAEKIMAAQRTRGLAWPIIDGWVIPTDQYTIYEAEAVQRYSGSDRIQLG